jgi:hypothetical protein
MIQQFYILGIYIFKNISNDIDSVCLKCNIDLLQIVLL